MTEEGEKRLDALEELCRGLAARVHSLETNGRPVYCPDCQRLGVAVPARPMGSAKGSNDTEITPRAASALER